jgi:hypothetical protein
VTVRLMNAAMMPQPGTYRAEALSQEEFVEALRAAPGFVSYVGYPQTAEWIQQIAGVIVPVSREQTVLEDGDVLLVCKLAYRVDPRRKGDWQQEDWEYCRVLYASPRDGSMFPEIVSK